MDSLKNLWQVEELRKRIGFTLLLLAYDVNGILLPVILVAMLLLINKHDLMGRHTNSRFYNVVAWATAVVLIGLTVAWLLALRMSVGVSPFQSAKTPSFLTVWMAVSMG